MRRIPVTRNFDRRDVIGYLLLRDDVELIPDFVFALAYVPLKKRGRIKVLEVSLVPDGPAQRATQEKETGKDS